MKTEETSMLNKLREFKGVFKAEPESLATTMILIVGLRRLLIF